MLLFTFLSVVVALTGAKSSVISLLFATVCNLLYYILKRAPLKIPALFLVSAVLMVSLFSTLLYPKALGGNRFLFFLREGNSVQISWEELDEIGEIMAQVNSRGEEQDNHGAVIIAEVVEYATSGRAESDLNAGLITEKQYALVKAMGYKLNHTATGARKLLWHNAIKEIRFAPLVGQGAMSFMDRYKTHPHNFFLEMAVDFGLPVMIAILLLGAYVLISLFCRSISQPVLGAFMLYVFTFLPQKMLIGSLYRADNFFQYGACIMIFLLLRKYPAQVSEKKGMRKRKELHE